MIIWGKWLKQQLLFLFVSATVVWVWHASCSSRQYWQTVKTFTTMWCVPCGITLPGVQQTRGGQGKWWPLCSSWARVMSLGGMSPTGRSLSHILAQPLLHILAPTTFTHLGPYHFHTSWPLPLSHILAPTTFNHLGCYYFHSSWPLPLSHILAPTTFTHLGPYHFHTSWPLPLSHILAPTTFTHLGCYYFHSSWPLPLSIILAAITFTHLGHNKHSSSHKKNR